MTKHAEQPQEIPRDFIIVDDTEVLHSGLSENDTLTAFAILTRPDEVKKAYADQPEEFARLFKLYDRMCIGKIVLARIVTKYPE